MSFIETRASLALNNINTNVQVVKFESHKPKVKNNPNDSNFSKASNTHVAKGTNKDLDLKNIRHEIVKFGMQGFDAPKKEEAKIALAISLGAKPPKREYVNYKELMQKRKEQKQTKMQEKEAMNSKIIMQGVNKPKKKKGTNKNDIGQLLNNYGKVQKQDLQKQENSSKIKKKK